MKFSFSKAASTLSLAALGVAAATSAQAAISSLELEISKITAYENATNTSDGSVVLFDAANGVGGSSNVTVDLLNSTDAAGKTIALKTLSTAEAGVYRTLVVELASFTATDDEANPTDLSSTGDALLTTGTDPFSGNDVIVLGETDTATAAFGIDDLYNAGGALAATAVMKPISTAGGVVTLPTLDIQIPATSVVDTGTGVAFTQAPVVATIAPASASTTDDASITDVRIQVELDTTTLESVVVPGEDATLTVGLFPSDNLTVDPIYVATATYTGTVTGTATTATQTVDIIDVANGTYLPIAWNDTNSNSKLDAGEKFAAANMADFSAGDIVLDGTAGQGDGFDGSTDVTTDFLDAAEVIDGVGAAMIGKTHDFVLTVADTAIDAANDSIAFTLDGGIAGAADGTTGTIVLNRNGALTTLPVTWFDEAASGGAIADTETALPVLDAAAVTAIAAAAGLSYDAIDTELTITLPYTETQALGASGWLTSAVSPAVLSATLIDDPAGTPATITSVNTTFDVAAAVTSDATTTAVGNDGAALND